MGEKKADQTNPLITFFYPKDISTDNFLVDEHPMHFACGPECHSLQSFLRLREMGCMVNIDTSVPEEGIVFAHADHAEQIPPANRRLVVLFLADRARHRNMADLWIVQNPKQVDRRSFHLDHWPQPGLTPRDPSRDNEIKNIVYMGRKENLHEHLCTEAWRRSVENLGLKWRIEETAWWDYTEVDVIVAVRRFLPKKWWRKILHIDGFWDHYKPASKLINSWLAGVPAILTNESSYLNLRQSELDYFAADTPDQVLSHLQRLQKEPELYAQMVANGCKRGASYSVFIIAERLWMLIEGPIQESYWKKIGRKR